MININKAMMIIIRYIKLIILIKVKGNYILILLLIFKIYFPWI
jgi:hypothetical protein